MYVYGRSPRGDPDFDTFFQAEYAAIVRTVTQIVRDREVAREIAQEAFIKGYARWWRISRYDKPGAWVRRVAIRMAVRHERRRRVLHRALQEERPPTPAPDTTLDAELHDALAKLSPRQRAAIALFYIEDRTVTEIAHILDCSESTVKVHLHNGRQGLRRLLERSVDDSG